MLSWATLFGTTISPSEAQALRRIDRAFREVQYKKDHPDPAPLSEQFAEMRRRGKEK